MLMGWISWGLGLIFGAILAREMGKLAHRRGMAVHYPLLAVAGYMGMSLTWGWGMSSSAGLLQATDNNVFMLDGHRGPGDSRRVSGSSIPIRCFSRRSLWLTGR